MRFYNLNLAQLRQIRDAKRDALADKASETETGMPKAPVCTGPTILCGMP